MEGLFYGYTQIRNWTEDNFSKTTIVDIVEDWQRGSWNMWIKMWINGFVNNFCG